MNSLSAGSICWLRESDLAKQMLSPLAGDRNPREAVECLFSVVSARAEISAQTAEDSNLSFAATSLTLESKSRCIASLSRGDGSGDWNPLPFRRCRVYRLRRLVASWRQNSFPRRDICVRASSDVLKLRLIPSGYR